MTTPSPPLTLEDYERLNPRCEVTHAEVTMVFATPSAFTRWRVDTLHDKEPWTLEWIATFPPDAVFLDVGANVGMYTIWAAMTRGVRVVAFEPEAQNYALLTRNIRFNRLDGRVKAYCAGLSDEAGLVDLHMADLRIGGSNHALGAARDFKDDPLAAQFVQGGIVFVLDRLVAEGRVPAPTHIKIDVDGIEPKVVAGARATLARPAVRSVLIETNPARADHRAMIETLTTLGFGYDPAQVARATRAEGPFKGMAEYVFAR